MERGIVTAKAVVITRSNKKFLQVAYFKYNSILNVILYKNKKKSYLRSQ